MVVNRKDIVPTLPSRFYFHLNPTATDAATMEEVTLGRVTGNFDDHAIGEYVANLAKVVGRLGERPSAGLI